MNNLTKKSYVCNRPYLSLQMGLEVARLEMFNTVNGARTSAPDVILLITDGVSSHADPNLDPDEQARFKVKDLFQRLISNKMPKSTNKFALKCSVVNIRLPFLVSL